MGVLAPLASDLDELVEPSDKKLIQRYKKLNVRLISTNLLAICAE